VTVDPKREAQIRAALAAGKIPKEYDGDVVDGDWEDMARELLREVDALRDRLQDAEDEYREFQERQD
jgi:phage shock protein A